VSIYDLVDEVVVNGCCDRLFVQVWCMVDEIFDGIGLGTG
jgi:hypothetical protein